LNLKIKKKGKYAAETEPGMSATILVPIDDCDEKEKEIILREAPLIKRFDFLNLTNLDTS
jgi:hypothetical protein